MAELKVALKHAEVEQLIDVCREFNNNPGELINVLHRAQGIFGYLPAEVQEIIARELNIPVAKVYGVFTLLVLYNDTSR